MFSTTEGVLDTWTKPSKGEGDYQGIPLLTRGVVSH